MFVYEFWGASGYSALAGMWHCSHFPFIYWVLFHLIVMQLTSLK